MPHVRNIFFLIFILSFSSISFAQTKLPEFQTTRVIQTGGAGVGALLTNEASILNPAAIVYLKDSTFYYQKSEIELDEKSSKRNSKFVDGDRELISITDTSTALKGGFSYIYQNEDLGKRKRFALSSAGPIGKNSSFGLLYKYTEENSDIIDNEYHQFTFGFTSIIHEDITTGLIIVDPTNKINEYSHFIFGAQYRMYDFIYFLADLGSGDVANTDKEAITRIAVQLNSFKYLYFRYGKFYDKYNNTKGFGYGISWNGPKFSIDYGVKTSELIQTNTDQLFDDEKFIETSFGITAIF